MLFDGKKGCLGVEVVDRRGLMRAGNQTKGTILDGLELLERRRRIKRIYDRRGVIKEGTNEARESLRQTFFVASEGGSSRSRERRNEAC